jgi:hypothetical protein
VSGLVAEIRVALRRTWGGKLVPVALAGAAVFIVVVRVVAPTYVDPVHRELARLESGNETIAFAMTLGALLIAYRLIAPDIRDEFESLSVRHGISAFKFAASRALVGIGSLLTVGTVLGLAVEVGDLGGRYQREEVLRVAVLFLNAIPVFMLAMVLMSVFGRIVGLIAPVVMQALGADAAYQRAALADGFIDPTPLFSFEQLISWLLPRPLIDPLLGIALMDQSAALRQLPVRQGNGVWGWDLIQVSGPSDVTFYAAYLVVVAGLLYIACRYRKAQARSRFLPVAGWLARGEADRDITP